MRKGRAFFCLIRAGALRSVAELNGRLRTLRMTARKTRRKRARYNPWRKERGVGLRSAKTGCIRLWLQSRRDGNLA